MKQRVTKHRKNKIGQAPGAKVHESGVPWRDASGDRLRDWTGLGVAGLLVGYQFAIGRSRARPGSY